MIHRDLDGDDGVEATPLANVLDAVARASQHLLARQHGEGYWLGELQGDTILESEFVLLMCILGRENDSRLPMLGDYIRKHQTPDGGWNTYPGGPTEVSVSVKAYFALKLLGDSPRSPHMHRARRAILEGGGAEACNSYSRFYLAALGQISYDAVPTIPPEIVLLPKRFYFSLYAMSAWTRTFVVPLCVLSAFQPVRRIPRPLGIAELFSDGTRRLGPLHRSCPRLVSWSNFFAVADQMLKVVERWPWKPLRGLALRAVQEWMLERCRRSDGLGAIFPPMVYLPIALRCLGYAEDHPHWQLTLRQLDGLLVADDDGWRVQPCQSPVWDTSMAVYALGESGVPAAHPALHRAAAWLASKEVRRHGDWQVRVPEAEPGGWHFEFANEFYPDVDDSAKAAMALYQVGRAEDRPAVDRAVRWILKMQNDDGGWAAFDRNVNREFLNHVPFADHNAMLDPSTPDITGRVLECLSRVGLAADRPEVRRAVEFLRRTQERDGSWFGRWGVNHIYGTWLALVGLAHAGQDLSQAWCRRAVRWLRDHQNPDGGWGESCRSYGDVSARGRGPSTASQTAWATMGLMAAHGPHDPSVRRGIAFLLDRQCDDGSWEETEFTGTGFPGVFYLRYHLYSVYFPLMALGRYARLGGAIPGPHPSWLHSDVRPGRIPLMPV